MYPGNSRPEILAVGAVYNYRRYANEIGDDWSSNYGPELDVMAPGVNIHTTDIQGDVGYTTNNYHENFSGTSASAPYVSGIAALVLSVNPNLTGKQVADIIEWSAQEVGGYDYKTMYGRPNGPWHEEMGYGLVNAYRAVSFSNPLNLSNQTFYGNSTYSSWDISTRNITIAGGAKLSLKAPIITVNDGFRLEVGGSFEFNN
jgi:subtilisin family serine protease